MPLCPAIVTEIHDGNTLKGVMVLLPRGVVSVNGADEWDLGFGFSATHADARHPPHYRPQRGFRLARIKAPELDEPGGPQARAALEAICPPRANVRVHASKLDKYGRVLADIITQDGRSVSDELLKSGHVAEYHELEVYG